ncbi:MAG: PRD domain-containing protein [Actinomycetaceae bacterium]|nr:PRD domain-containing protein [Actinomycetaceae bacterium]
MVEDKARIVRAFNNNAVLASVGGDEFVLAGRGIGFGRKPGDLIDLGSVQQRYIELSSDRVEFLKSVNSLEPKLVATVSSAVDLAADMLGELDPSVYVVLADHLSFAVQRHRTGQQINNRLTEEIKVVFPREFAAAKAVTQYVNTHLEVKLPVDESAFIALHLNAARTGDSIKQPLNIANQVASTVKLVQERLGEADEEGLEELLLAVRRLINRTKKGQIRKNRVTRQIEMCLPEEMDLARAVINTIAADLSQSQVDDEAAFFATFLHGWRQSVSRA